MKPERDIQEFFRKAAAGADPAADRKVLAKVLAAHEAARPNGSALNRPSKRSTIMKSPVTRLAVAAVVLVAALVGIGLFGGSPASVAWGEVARKVEASRSVAFRRMQSRTDPNYSMSYLSATHSRTDKYEAGRITVSHYLNFETMTASSVYHTDKHYWRDAPLGRQNAQEHDQMSDPKWLVKSLLSCEHRELGRKTIDGVACEGLETTDPTVFGGDLPVPPGDITMQVQLWVSVETSYPVLCEGTATLRMNGQTRTRQWVLDQFRWDAELDPPIFEPNIPPDYTEI